MAHIKITKGLDIPLKGKPEGPLQALIPSGHSSSPNPPSFLGLNLRAFDDIKFRLLVKVGDLVSTGQPLAEDKSTPGRMFVSPTTGVVKEIRRGLKRSLQEIIIETANAESFHPFSKLNPQNASRKEITDLLLAGGSFASIHTRPFNLLADPNKPPRAIFVKAVESAPFVPPAELQVAGYEKEFQTGLEILAKLTDGLVHLVYHQNSTEKAFTSAAGVQKHTVEGPHPIANHSVHIQNIDPIRSTEDVIWTLTALDVVSIGYLVTHDKYFTERVVSIAGPGILPGRTGYFKLRAGYPISTLIAGRTHKGLMRFISGDPLMGKKVTEEDFLGFYHTAFCVIPENVEREFLHFMGLGLNKFSFSKAYMSGHLDNSRREYDFTTNQHGEHRPFIDSSLYDQTMPLNVPTMLLVKAVMAEDFELADTLGILEVASEDFALPTFVCPSKMEMTEIMEAGIKQYAKEILV